MILVYNIFSVALLGAKLASLKWPEPLEMPTRPLEELQKKYCTLESQQALLWVGLAGSRPGCGKTPARQLRTRWLPRSCGSGQDGRHLRSFLPSYCHSILDHGLINTYSSARVFASLSVAAAVGSEPTPNPRRKSQSETNLKWKAKKSKSKK